MRLTRTTKTKFKVLARSTVWGIQTMLLKPTVWWTSPRASWFSFWVARSLAQLGHLDSHSHVLWIYGIGPSCFFTMYAGIRPLCTSIWYNSSLDDASMILHLTSVFIALLMSWECSRMDGISLDAISVTLRFDHCLRHGTYLPQRPRTNRKMDPALAGLPSVHVNTLEQWLANMAPNYRQCTMPRKYMHNAAEEAQQLKRPNIGRRKVNSQW